MVLMQCNVAMLAGGAGKFKPRIAEWNGGVKSWSKVGTSEKVNAMLAHRWDALVFSRVTQGGARPSLALGILPHLRWSHPSPCPIELFLRRGFARSPLRGEGRVTGGRVMTIVNRKSAIGNSEFSDSSNTLCTVDHD